jgi:mono/diheme cytochrome c family protein/plastocyanin
MAAETPGGPSGSLPTDPAGRAPQERLPARRNPVAPPASAERFTAPPSTHLTGGLTPARSAQIVRQSGNARWISFLGVTIVALFVIAYYFYETGLPFGLTQPRLDAQATVQQVQSVERGYNLFEANCSRCHGVNGEGGIGPVLNDQMKLFDHLNPTYIKNVLTVGGRYVCGNPNSVMPVWADTNGGPLNYVQIQDLINFLRAPSTETFVVRNPSLNEPVIGPDGKVETFKGWVDPNFKPDPSATPVPACWSGTAGGGSAAPSGPAASLPPGAPTFDITASSFAFDKKDLSVAANTAFGITFTNADPPGTDHDVDIRQSDGTTVVIDQPVTDGGQTSNYVYKGLPAGTYTFICSVHPSIMHGTLTVGP